MESNPKQATGQREATEWVSYFYNFSPGGRSQSTSVRAAQTWWDPTVWILIWSTVESETRHILPLGTTTKTDKIYKIMSLKTLTVRQQRRMNWEMGNKVKASLLLERVSSLLHREGNLRRTYWIEKKDKGKSLVRWRQLKFIGLSNREKLQ